MLRRFIIFMALLAAAVTLRAADPMSTTYSWDECQGSARPYPVPAVAYDYPDTLTPVMINHVGRHGARFPASPAHCSAVFGALRQAEERGTITPAGRKLLGIVTYVMEQSAGRWGALDSLGMAEQRGIASRMYASFPMLFTDGPVNAISSWSPRCIMSMYEFTHQLARLDNRVEITTASGRRFSPLMRFFDLSDDYLAYRKSDTLRSVVDTYFRQNVPLEPLRRVLGKDFELPENAADLAMAEYSVLAGLQAMDVKVDVSPFLTPQEYNALWGAFNLRQYLQHSASTLSGVPMDIASPLLIDLISTTDGFIAGTVKSTVNLRFGHAETLMPLLALMHLPGCYYLTNYFDTVGKHWLDFNIVPMAANLQMILFRSDSGKYYLRTDLNEIPMTLIPGDDTLYLPWTRARVYLERCLPLYY